VLPDEEGFFRDFAEQVDQNQIRRESPAAHPVERIFLIQREEHAITIPLEITPEDRSGVIVFLYQKDNRLSCFTAHLCPPC
jgi:hypothetical protein